MRFREFSYLDDVDELVVCLPETCVPPAGLLNEGQWIGSGKADWMMRVDAANPAIPLQRHVHIARARHVRAKNQQASWNQDGTRHDKGSFNASVGAQKVVQDLARSALGLDVGAILEQRVPPQSMLLESAAEIGKTITIYMVMTNEDSAT
ncbi:hypothetical protein GCM10022279_12150 [Comamonas faecalis]|uniref:Uncharacterized protein n=1 Tax=Comamonas faecalis TaxID=1387849 RepID=A0ABP7R000_9BURK|nr:DUF6367 family protein [Oryzisolibacter propanilivorax]